MQVAHKIEINANNKQKTYFRKACGVARFSYNWGLAEWNKQFSEGKKVTGLSLKKEFNRIKKTEFSWTKEVTKYAAQQPFLDLNKAFNRFFKKKSKYPQFKKKGKSKDSFYIGGDQISIKNNKLHIPNLGLVTLKEKFRFVGKINSVTISRHADHWFASIQVELKELDSFNKNQIVKKVQIVGIDLGIINTCTISDGIAFKAPKPLKYNLRKLKREQRQLSKKVKNSKNREKQKRKVANIHYKISNIRKDVLHKMTSFLTRKYTAIGIEDLNVRGMLKNHKLARAISDIGIYEFRRQLIYKSERYNCKIVLKDRFFPSSKLCSNQDCKTKNEKLTLKVRIFKCHLCGLELDRDLNASINIDPIPKVLRKFTPVEITAMQKLVYPVLVTSIA